MSSEGLIESWLAIALISAEISAEAGLVDMKKSVTCSGRSIPRIAFLKVWHAAGMA